jgi:hypothetical protein
MDRSSPNRRRIALKGAGLLKQAVGWACVVLSAHARGGFDLWPDAGHAEVIFTAGRDVIHVIRRGNIVVCGARPEASSGWSSPHREDAEISLSGNAFILAKRTTCLSHHHRHAFAPKCVRMVAADQNAVVANDGCNWA